MSEGSLELLIDAAVTADLDFDVMVTSNNPTLDVVTVDNLNVDVDGTSSDDLDSELIYNPDETSVEVSMLQGEQGEQGERGERGEQGPPGSILPSEGIVYTQGLPSDVWEFNNPFDYRPHVVTYVNDGSEIIGLVLFPPGLIRVEFSYPLTGSLRAH